VQPSQAPEDDSGADCRQLRGYPLHGYAPLDILLVRPDGEIAKPWLTVVLDDYSRAVGGYFLSFEDPSALHTSPALRQAIWLKEDPRWIVCGMPSLEKRLAHYPQFYSRIGFVHEFRQLSAGGIRQPLEHQRRLPAALANDAQCISASRASSAKRRCWRHSITPTSGHLRN
jgi:hypothetical protein